MSNGSYLMLENESSIYIEGSKYYVSLAYTYTILNLFSNQANDSQCSVIEAIKKYNVCSKLFKSSKSATIR